jgi:dihydropteroate synthase
MEQENVYTLNCNGRLVYLDEPKVMGILNLTPDSFYDGGQYLTETQILNQVEKMLLDGASIIDIGAVSSMPNAKEVAVEEEERRIFKTLKSVVKHFPDAIISVDTFRSSIAKQAIDFGAAMINDIYAANFNEDILSICAKYQVPIILMHMQGNPSTMQIKPTYNDVVVDILDFFIQKINLAMRYGVHDVVVDVGFGFGKTMTHNYTLLKYLESFKILNKPILVGISRKSMIHKLLAIEPKLALNGTSILHTLALQNGANILRAHDVKEAMECINIFNYYNKIK